MSKDNSLLVKTPYDDDIDDMFNGLDSVHGRNDRWIQKRIYQLEHVERDAAPQQELEDKRVEFGLTATGRQKPRVCWDFVRVGKCTHGWIAGEDGGVHGGIWHPGKKEAVYLKGKMSL